MSIGEKLVQHNFERKDLRALGGCMSLLGALWLIIYGLYQMWLAQDEAMRELLLGMGQVLGCLALIVILILFGLMLLDISPSKEEESEEVN